MSLRLIEAVVPKTQAEQLRDILEDYDTLGIWITAPDDDSAVVRILANVGDTEAISDALSEHCSHLDNFRLMLFAVEATLPMPEVPDITEAADDETDEAEQSDQQQASAERISREELYQDIADGARLSIVYVVTVALSTIVAAVGLLRDSVAVIVGAMVIAPLLGPNMALALASTLGDLGLAKRSLVTLLAGIVIVMVISVGIGWTIPVDIESPEIASRTEANSGDILLAIAAGSAGALAVTTGIPAAVIGVMVAVALLPPLVVAGLLVGAGEYGLAGGAFLLLVSNIACINLAGVVTFLVQKIRPRLWSEAETAGRAAWSALALWVLAVGILLAVTLLTS